MHQWVTRGQVGQVSTSAHPSGSADERTSRFYGAGDKLTRKATPPLYDAEVRKLGFRSWRGIGLAARWTLSTPAGWSFLAARVIVLALAFWVQGRYGGTAAFVTTLIALVVAGLVSPPAPDPLDSEVEERSRADAQD